MYMYFFVGTVSLVLRILNYQRVQNCYFLRQKPKHANLLCLYAREPPVTSPQTDPAWTPFRLPSLLVFENIFSQAWVLSIWNVMVVAKKEDHLQETVATEYGAFGEICQNVWHPASYHHGLTYIFHFVYIPFHFL